MKRGALAAILSMAVGLGACGVACSAGPRSEATVAAQVPAELRASFDLFAHRCSKCHGLSRALESGITDDDQWVNYVRRMRLQPMSGISEADEQAILPFLRHYAHKERERKAAAALTAPPPTSEHLEAGAAP